jgi:hypothetical protein
MTSAVVLSKLAHDAGFVVELGETDGWLAFAIPGRDLKLWLRAQDEALIAALSHRDVLAEIPFGVAWSGALLRAAQGARLVASANDLLTLLQRARVLERTLPNALLDDYRASIVDVDTTAALALVRQRRGQALFRKGLFDYWGGRCAITGLDVPDLLRASHAKPRKDASNAERLDVHNGLLLAAHLDAAYDQGLMTGYPDGRVEPSRRLPSGTAGLA